MFNQFEQVRPFDGITASEDEDRDLERGDLTDEVLAFCRSEFAGVALELRGSAAVEAGEVAGLGDLPDGEEWTFVEVDGVVVLLQLLIHDRTPRRCSVALHRVSGSG